MRARRSLCRHAVNSESFLALALELRRIPYAQPRAAWDEATGRARALGLTVADARTGADGARCFAGKYYEGCAARLEGGCRERLGPKVGGELRAHFAGGVCEDGDGPEQYRRCARAQSAEAAPRRQRAALPAGRDPARHAIVWA